MKHRLLLSFGLSIVLFAARTQAQCILGNTCDDGDTCTTADVVTEVIAGTAICGDGSVEIPNPASDTYTDSLTLEQQQFVSPFLFDYAAKMARQQFLFRRSELDVEMNQLNGHPDATGGLGTCEPVTAIAFYVGDTITVDNQKNMILAVRLKHAPADVHELSLGFDNSIDTAAGCLGGVVLSLPVLGPPGWRTFELGEPFLWDGVRDVILDWATNTGNENMLSAPLSVRYTTIEGEAPANQLTYTVTAYPPYSGDCNPFGTDVCGQVSIAAALPSTASCFATAGSSNLRPSVLFIGGATTAPPATCTCAGVIADTDADGLPDCNDPCPLGANPGAACDDGDESTVDDVVGADCVCAGTLVTALQDNVVGTSARVWPNPCAADVLHVSGMAGGMMLDASGRVVRTFQGTRTIDLSGVVPGLYLLRFANGEQVRVIRE